MRLASNSERRVLALGQFPPPVHGMSVTTERFTQLLEARTSTRRVQIGADAPGHSILYHLVRMLRVARATVLLVTHRRRCRAVYISCDAGLGMIYMLVLLAGTRVLRYAVFLHHFSYANLRRRSRLLAMVVRVGGTRCTQVVTCRRMAADFRSTYPKTSKVAIVPYDFLIEPGPVRPKADANRPLVVGHISNLTKDKGIELVFKTVRAAIDSGADVRLLVAGPVADREAASIIEAGLGDLGDQARYLGPVYDDSKRAFYADIDVFLFPSRYFHESFGIVAGEALACGVPVIAYESGCLEPDYIGDGARIIGRSEAFIGPAAAQLKAWGDDRRSLLAAAKRARRDADARRAEAWKQASELVRSIAFA